MNASYSSLENNSLTLRSINYDIGHSGPWVKKEPVRLLNDINLTLKPGKITALVGESGSGKSTIAKILCRLITPTEGTLRLNGTAVDSGRDSRKLFSRKVQMVFQNPYDSLNPMHTVNYHLERALKLSLNYNKHQIAQRIGELLQQVGLTPANIMAKKLPSELSGGQRQRLSLARALALDPRYIIADEPTSMLDVSIRLGILNLLKSIVAQGTGLLLITHDLATARYMSDDIMILYCGHVVEYGKTENIIQTPSHPYTQLLMGASISSDTNWNTMERNTLAGAEPPRWTPSKRGCPFANRCALASDKCRTHSPTLTTTPDFGEVACWHAGEIA